MIVDLETPTFTAASLIVNFALVLAASSVIFGGVEIMVIASFLVDNQTILDFNSTVNNFINFNSSF